MINIKTKIVGHDDDNQFVQIKKYKTKHTTTAEHLCLIDMLVGSIIDNDEDMNINKLCKLIKENYKVRSEDNE